VAASNADSVTAFQAIHFLENEAELIYLHRPEHGDNTEIMALLLRGVLLFEEGSQQEGLTVLAEAFKWETNIDPPRDGPCMPIIPSFELYARYLLKAGQADEALQVLKSGNYTSSRNRGSTLLLFAQASEQTGDLKAACTHYETLVANFAIMDLAIREIDEAGAFLVANCLGNGTTFNTSPATRTASAPASGYPAALPRSFSHLELQEGVADKRIRLQEMAWSPKQQRESLGHC